VDGKVPVLYKQVAQLSDWKVVQVKKAHYDWLDKTIAKEYGKGTCALFTFDKTAYKDNVDGGFIGYFIYDNVSKSEEPLYLKKLKNTFTSFTSTKTTGYIIHTKRNKEKYEKIPIPEKK